MPMVCRCLRNTQTSTNEFRSYVFVIIIVVDVVVDFVVDVVVVVVVVDVVVVDVVVVALHECNSINLILIIYYTEHHIFSLTSLLGWECMELAVARITAAAEQKSEALREIFGTGDGTNTALNPYVCRVTFL